FAIERYHKRRSGPAWFISPVRRASATTPYASTLGRGARVASFRSFGSITRRFSSRAALTFLSRLRLHSPRSWNRCWPPTRTQSANSRAFDFVVLQRPMLAQSVAHVPKAQQHEVPCTHLRHEGGVLEQMRLGDAAAGTGRIDDVDVAGVIGMEGEERQSGSDVGDHAPIGILIA